MSVNAKSLTSDPKVLKMLEDMKEEGFTNFMEGPMTKLLLSMIPPTEPPRDTEAASTRCVRYGARRRRDANRYRAR